MLSQKLKNKEMDRVGGRERSVKIFLEVYV